MFAIGASTLVKQLPFCRLGFAPSSAAALRRRPPRRAPLAPHPRRGLLYSRLLKAPVYRRHDASVLSRMDRGQNTTSLPSSEAQASSFLLLQALQPKPKCQPTSLPPSRLCLEESESQTAKCMLDSECSTCGADKTPAGVCMVTVTVMSY